MMLYMWGMLQVDPTHSTWELAKGVMLTLTTMGVAWIARTVFLMRDGVIWLKDKVGGPDGKNGLVGDSKACNARIGKLEMWQARILDAEERASAAYQGEERRLAMRRELDKALLDKSGL